MYKVKPEDIIPIRSDEETERLKAELTGSTPKAAKKAHKLVAQFQALSRNMSQDTILPMVELAYKISDLANAKSTTNAVCAKGCSHCCQVNVEVTDLEAAYIEIKTGHKVVEQKYSLPVTSKLIPYCTFHDEETATCKIWEFRPMACRGFFAFDDPKYCVGNNQTHAITSTWNNPGTKQIFEVLQHCGNGVTNDIRYYFGYKL